VLAQLGDLGDLYELAIEQVDAAIRFESLAGGERVASLWPIVEMIAEVDDVQPANSITLPAISARRRCRRRS